MTKAINCMLTILALSLSQNSFSQKSIADTVFLLKESDDSNYHAIFIDTLKKSEYYTLISDFEFGQFDKDGYDYSLEYLRDKKIKLTKNKISDIAKKWIVLKYYKKQFYNYCPSDFYTHFKVSITDTTFIDYSGEGPSASKINTYKKLNEKTFLFSLTSIEKPKRNLIIHIIDKQNGIAIFEEHNMGKDKQYYLMIDASKFRQLPIIVNYCVTQKQMEFNFDNPDFKQLLRMR